MKQANDVEGAAAAHMVVATLSFFSAMRELHGDRIVKEALRMVLAVPGWTAPGEWGDTQSFIRQTVTGLPGSRRR